MMMKPSAHAVSLLGLLCAAPFSAHAGQTDLNEVLVTASRMEQPRSEVLADVTVIGCDEIVQSGATGLVDVLARVPGVQFARNGGVGSTSSVFVRGADTRFTAVFIDGIRVDSQSTGGATWEAIPLAQIDRIEVLRGAAAAVYGSDAIAGVVQIFTKKGSGVFSPYVGVGIGSDKLRRFDSGFSGAVGAFDYAIGLSKEVGEGFNAHRQSNPDLDGHKSDSANVRLGFDVSNTHRLELTALNSYMNAQYDGSATDDDDHSVHRLDAMGLHWKTKWNDAWSSRFSVTESQDQFVTEPSPFGTQTKVRNYLVFNAVQKDNWQGSVALERREDTLDNSSTTPMVSERSQNALALGYGWQPGAHAFQVNARHDDDSEFGGKTTGLLAYAYQFLPQWKVNVAVGTAFRAPTLFQRFSEFGAASLQPESSQSREVGLNYVNQDTAFGLVFYKNKIDNLISFVDTSTACASASVPGGFPGCYESTKHAQMEGVTVTASKTINTVRVAGSVDLLDPKDLDTGRNLARRAEKHAALSVDAPVGQWKLGSELLAYGSRFDNAANTVEMGGYGLINAFATRKFNRDFTLVLRANNVFDKAYQQANNYNTQGRGLFAGVHWDFGS